ncbi:MAG: DNA-processing protein DprA [Eubacterium sp.]|nr:DNA-processing protein DprA [Eubacterium sp.]
MSEWIENGLQETCAENNTDLLSYKYWFAGLTGLSATQKIQLVSAATEKELYHMSELELFQLCEYYNADASVIVTARQTGSSPEEIRKKAQKERIFLTTYDDKTYPRKLRNINQSPYALYYKGQLPGDEVCVAIVGSRKCSEYGRCMTETLAEELAKNQVPVISGMAYGIDCAGHAGALRGKGKTYGVLGCGVDICYPPAARTIYENISQSTGGILSEYAPGTNPLPIFFPQRNRIISGLADIVVVMEARLRSGSLITADFAMEQGKDVYALPGRISDKNSQGTNRLIYQGAGILDDIEQFLVDTNLAGYKQIVSKKENKFVLEKEEALLYSGLNFEPKYLDTIIEETGLPVGHVLAILDGLKRKKLVKESYKNYFSRTSY